MDIQIEKEKALIGMLLQRPAAFADVAQTVSLQDFTDPQAQRTWTAFLLLEERGMQVGLEGLITVARETGSTDAQRSQDLTYWLEARRNTASTVNIFPLAKSLAEDGRIRRIRLFLSDLCKRSAEDNMSSDRLLAEADAGLLALGERSGAHLPVMLTEPMTDNVRLIRQHMEEGSALTGLSTGFARLDEATLGFQPSDLIILAARPACGKTTMALSLLLNMARQGTPVGFFSIEMGARQIAMKALSHLCRIGGYKLRKGYLTEDELTRLTAAGSPSELPFYLSDNPVMTLADIRRQARLLVKQHGVRCICVDYLQLVSTPERTGRYYSREHEVAQISRGLKAIAKELDITVLALAQMNRAVEQRRLDGGRPQLSDLRESGSIEQDADLVCFLHKRDFSNWLSEQPSANMAATAASAATASAASAAVASGKSSLPVDKEPPCITTLIIAKHRTGLCTDIDFRFRGEYSLFEEYEPKKT